MTTRILDDKTVGNKRVALSYSPEWEEYKLKFYVDGKYQVDADYFDSDKSSILSTAGVFLGVTM